MINNEWNRPIYPQAFDQLDFDNPTNLFQRANH